MKAGAFSLGAIDGDPAPVLPDDSVDNGEAQAGALADFLGGKKRLENACEVLRADS